MWQFADNHPFVFLLIAVVALVLADNVLSNWFTAWRDRKTWLGLQNRKS